MVYLASGKVARIRKKAMSRKKDENDEIRRLKINERERRRMHDLNSAMDGLRSVMPYARGNFGIFQLFGFIFRLKS